MKNLTLIKSGTLTHVRVNSVLLGSIGRESGGFVIRKTGLCRAVNVMIIPFRTEQDAIDHMWYTIKMFCSNLAANMEDH